MEEVLVGLLALAAGGLVGHFIKPRVKTVEIERVKEVPVLPGELPAELVKFNELWATKQRMAAKSLAIDYVLDNKQLFQRFESLTLEQLVEFIDSVRAVGNVQEQTLADMWLLTQYEPQNIVGTVNIGTGAN